VHRSTEQSSKNGFTILLVQAGFVYSNPDLSQSEEGQDEQNDDDQTDDVNDGIHEAPFSLAGN
jgi:hypothetical protein